MKDYFDNEDYDDLFGEGDEFGKKPSFEDFVDTDFKELIDKLKVIREEQLIMENYDNIIKNGIDIEGIAEYGEDNVRRLKETLNIMIKFFEDREDYEKCHDVKMFCDRVEEIEF
tara:strand:- start:88 stop:429 length:342 start_codon:yes stop_codon:yes gene_type:complete